MGSRRRAQGDEGSALIFVVGTMMILMLLSVAALGYTVSSTKFARYDQDFTGAVAAAQSGIDDFIARLNRDDNYYQNVDCANPALKGPTAGANGCGWSSSTAPGWIPVEASRSGAKDAYFHYSFDASSVRTDGTVSVRSTGKVNGEYRTVEAAVGKDGSTDYVYYTDFESSDPANKVNYASTPSNTCGGAGATLAKHWWEGRNSASPACVEPQFYSGDTLWGAVFSNDSLYSNGASFKDTVTSANPDCANVVPTNTSTWNKCLRRQNDGTYSTANFNGKPPKLSEDGKKYLDDTSGEFANYPGCHYYGSTRIVFASNGTMRVWNVRRNNGDQLPRAIGVGGVMPNCGTLTDLDSTAGALVDVPTNMVIYAQGNTSGLARKQCDRGQLGGPSGRTLPLGTWTSAAYGVRPTSSSSILTYDQTMAETPKVCQAGNLYVEGVVKGRVTLSSEASIVLTGDLVLAAGTAGSDQVGLVAQDSVEVFRPWMYKYTSSCGSVTCSWAGTGVEGEAALQVSGWPTHYADPSGATAVSGVQVMGSIQTLQHSFLVQRYNKNGCSGTLQVDGSIAQRWRGAVGTLSGSTCSTGYLKNYVYDTRLKYSAPPYFPRWVNAQWSQRYFGEIRTDPKLRH
jgi:Tfp pilus assembly protein PilX